MIYRFKNDMYKMSKGYKMEYVRLLFLSDFEFTDEVFDCRYLVEVELENKFMHECAHEAKDVSASGHEFAFIGHILEDKDFNNE